jgi:hypothetical protein
VWQQEIEDGTVALAEVGVPAIEFETSTAGADGSIQSRIMYSMPTGRSASRYSSSRWYRRRVRKSEYLHAPSLRVIGSWWA